MSRVRPATAADAEAVACLRALRGATAAQATAWVERYLADGLDGRLFVAEAGEAVVGYGLTTRFEPPADAPAEAAPAGYYLTGVVVDPAHRRRGLGAALTARRLAWIFKRAERAYYFADDDNRASVALHAAVGFAPLTRAFWFPGLSAPETPMTLYVLER